MILGLLSSQDAPEREIGSGPGRAGANGEDAAIVCRYPRFWYLRYTIYLPTTLAVYWFLRSALTKDLAAVFALSAMVVLSGTALVTVYRRLSQPLELVARDGKITLRFWKRTLVFHQNEVRLFPHLNSFFDEGGQFVLTTPNGRFLIFANMKGVNRLLELLKAKESSNAEHQKVH